MKSIVHYANDRDHKSLLDFEVFVILKVFEQENVRR